MDYKKHYKLLCERAKTRSLDYYTEKHHIVPKCMGGTDDSDNLVDLTPEEHYVAHQLLVKIYPSNSDLIYAANMMSVGSRCTKRNNKRYGWLRRRHQEVCKKRVGDKNPSFGRKWYYCPNTLENGKFLIEDVPAGWVKGRILDKSKHLKKLKNIKEREKLKQERIYLANQLFKKFCQEGFRSLQEFIDAGHYDRSNEALRMLWKTHVPEYSENSSQGKPFNLRG